MGKVQKWKKATGQIEPMLSCTHDITPPGGRRRQGVPKIEHQRKSTCIWTTSVKPMRRLAYKINRGFRAKAHKAKGHGKYWKSPPCNCGKVHVGGTWLFAACRSCRVTCKKSVPNHCKGKNGRVDGPKIVRLCSVYGGSVPRGAPLTTAVYRVIQIVRYRVRHTVCACFWGGRWHQRTYRIYYGFCFFTLICSFSLNDGSKNISTPSRVWFDCFQILQYNYSTGAYGRPVQVLMAVQQSKLKT